MTQPQKTPAKKTKKNPVRKAKAPPNKQIPKTKEREPIELLPELKAEDVFACWIAEEDEKGKVKRAPRCPISGKLVGYTDRKNLHSYKTAHDAYMEGRFDGISRVVFEGDEYSVVDLDDCRNPETGKFTRETERIISKLLSYSEESPSGTGAHTWVKAKKPGGKCKKALAQGASVEIYDKAKAVTMTGKPLFDYAPFTEVQERQEELDKVYFELWPGESEEETGHKALENFVAYRSLTNEEAIERVKAKKPELWDGLWEEEGYASQSEADLALCSEIAYWVSLDPDRTEEIFRESSLYRAPPKKGKDYPARTVKVALAGKTRFYGENLLNRVILPVEDFSALKVEPKKMILHPWLPESSVTMIAGPPGIGKSMLVKSQLISITHGQDFGPFEVVVPVPCLYLDGEMDQQTTKERLALLSPGSKSKEPLYVYSDAYASTLKGVPPANLFDEKWRDHMTQMLEELGVKIAAFDNLVSLSPGIDEDRKVDYDPANQWFKSLRYKGIAVILIHHTNKSGDQRGTSAREDNMDVVILLKRPQGYFSHHGVRFKMHLRKARNMKPRDLKLVGDTIFELEEAAGDKLVWKFESKRRDLIKGVVEMVAANPKATNKDIAADLDISSSYVGTIKSRAIVRWKYLKSDGSLTDEGRRYCGLDEEEEEEDEIS